MQLIVNTGVLFLIFNLLGCASTPVHGPTCEDMGLPSLPNTRERLAFESFSIIPPQGEYWCIWTLDKKRGGIFFKNRFGGRIFHGRPEPGEWVQTLGAFVLVAPAVETIDTEDKLIAYLEKEIRKELNKYILNSSSFDIHGLSRQDQAICAINKLVIEGYISETKNSEVFFMEEHNLVCRHPSRPEMIRLSYSERQPKNYPLS
ncbi:MAG: hypothetical protein ACU826_12320, partial [Gammaproteobacteria bacterium]